MALYGVILLVLCGTVYGGVVSTEPVASGPCQLDLCIVMDLYDGVLPQNWDKTLDFLDDVVVGLNIGGSGTRTGLWLFDGKKGKKQWQINDYQNTYLFTLRIAVQKLKAVSYAGKPSLITVVKTASKCFTAKAGDRGAVDNVALIITDGKSSGKHSKVQSKAASLAAKASKVVVVSVESFDQAVLTEIATNGPGIGGKRLYYSNTYDDFASILNNVMLGICDNAMLPTTTTTTPLPTTPAPTTTFLTTTDLDIPVQPGCMCRRRRFQKWTQICPAGGATCPARLSSARTTGLTQP